MKQYLIPQSGTFYKVNMHSHSVLSDGKQTPEELKKSYLDHGYSAIAFTEHGRLHNLSHLTDENFVAIVSYEMDMQRKDRVPFSFYEGEPRDRAHMEHIHLNLYAKDPNQRDYPDISELRKQFTIENINEAIRMGKEMGFLVVYNHPHWSLNTHELYSKLRGIDGMEIINGGSQRSSDLDYMPLIYDEMVRERIRLPMCIGGDDNHDVRHYFSAWTMVKSDKLSYANLMTALEKGDCYASDGPEIHEIFVEDGSVTVRCSEAVGIYYTALGRTKNCCLSEDKGSYVTEATFPIGENDGYFRITVRDAQGRHACTRAYYLDELK